MEDLCLGYPNTVDKVKHVHELLTDNDNPLTQIILKVDGKRMSYSLTHGDKMDLIAYLQSTIK